MVHKAAKFRIEWLHLGRAVLPVQSNTWYGHETETLARTADLALEQSTHPGLH